MASRQSCQVEGQAATAMPRPALRLGCTASFQTVLHSVQARVSGGILQLTSKGEPYVIFFFPEHPSQITGPRSSKE